MMYRIDIKDSASYLVPASDFQNMAQAIDQACDWFDERKHSIQVQEISDHERVWWAVVNPDGTFAGVPCESEEVARELACQREGRRIFEMTCDPAAQILWN